MVRMKSFLILSILSAGIFAGDKTDSAPSESDYSAYYDYRSKPFLLRIGVGSGYCYGGLFGSSLETGFNGFTLIGGIGLLGKYLGWAAGIRLYASEDEHPFRLHVTITYGPVYAYYLWINEKTYQGVVNGVSPTLNAQHSLGKFRRISLTYGLGAWIRQDIKEPDKGPAEFWHGPKRWGLTYNAGINYNIESILFK